MREDIKKTLCDLQERAAKDIQKLLDAKSDFSPTEWKAASDAMDIIKDVEKSIKDALTSAAMEEEYGSAWDEEDSYRNMNYGRYPMQNYYAKDGMNYGRRPAKNSYRGSSYSNGNSTTVANLRNLMNNATSESERMMYQRFIDEAEHM